MQNNSCVFAGGCATYFNNNCQGCQCYQKSLGYVHTTQKDDESDDD